MKNKLIEAFKFAIFLIIMMVVGLILFAIFAFLIMIVPMVGVFGIILKSIIVLIGLMISFIVIDFIFDAILFR